MSYHTKLRGALIKKRAELEERVRRTTADMHRQNAALSQDFEDQASERENDEVVERIHDAAQTEIVAVDRALQRIDNGTYGRCASCGRPIEETRLDARPEAETCVACAKKASKL